MGVGISISLAAVCIILVGIMLAISGVEKAIKEIRDELKRRNGGEKP